MVTQDSEEIRRLFAEWRALYNKDFTTDAEIDANGRACNAIARKMMAIQPVTAVDLARQVICDTGDHHFDFGGEFFNRILRPLADIPARDD